MKTLNTIIDVPAFWPIRLTYHKWYIRIYCSLRIVKYLACVTNTNSHTSLNVLCSILCRLLLSNTTRSIPKFVWQKLAHRFVGQMMICSRSLFVRSQWIPRPSKTLERPSLQTQCMASISPSETSEHIPRDGAVPRKPLRSSSTSALSED